MNKQARCWDVNKQLTGSPSATWQALRSWLCWLLFTSLSARIFSRARDTNMLLVLALSKSACLLLDSRVCSLMSWCVEEFRPTCWPRAASLLPGAPDFGSEPVSALTRHVLVTRRVTWPAHPKRPLAPYIKCTRPLEKLFYLLHELNTTGTSQTKQWGEVF